MKHLTQKEVSRLLGYSGSNIKRHRDDNNIDPPYKRKIYRKKNTRTNTPNTISSTNENTKNIIKSKNIILKGVISSHGAILIE